jgi:hypothetical protein
MNSKTVDFMCIVIIFKIIIILIAHLFYRLLFGTLGLIRLAYSTNYNTFVCYEICISHELFA